MPVRFENTASVFQKSNFLKRFSAEIWQQRLKADAEKKAQKISSKKSIKGNFIYLFTSPLPLQ